MIRVKKYYECYFDENNKIQKILSYAAYLWVILIFWIVPVYCLAMLFIRTFSRKNVFYITREDYHKKKYEELRKSGMR